MVMHRPSQNLSLIVLQSSYAPRHHNLRDTATAQAPNTQRADSAVDELVHLNKRFKDARQIPSVLIADAQACLEYRQI
jgi:hypothetical protein